MTVIMKTTLGEIADFVNGGAWNQDEYSIDGIPVVRVTDIRGETVDMSDCKHLPKTSLQKYSKHLLRAGDLVICTVGSHPSQPGSVVGRVAVIQPGAQGALLNQNAVRIRSASPQVNQDWLGYLARSKPFRVYIVSCATGSASQVRMAIGLLKQMRVEVPPLPIQRRIAGILSAYDALIENSQRRIKILEEMARRLYREWFVYFRFPGHEGCRLVQSPLGEIPEGWEVKSLGDIAVVNRSTINMRNPPNRLGYIDIASVSPGRVESVTDYLFSEAPGRARRIVSHGDVLWSCVRPNRRSHAQVMHPEENTIASTGFAVLTALKVPATFLYQATTTDEFVAYLTNNATGAAYPAVTAPTFENAKLVVPETALSQSFGELTIPMAEEVHVIQRQVDNLRRTRDLLLPRLLCGQIDVEALPEPVVSES